MIYDSLSKGKITSRKSSRARFQFEEFFSLVRDERKRSSQRGYQRDERKPRERGVMETKEAKKTSKELEVTCIAWPWQRSAPKSPVSLVEGGTEDFWQLIAISGNCQSTDRSMTFHRVLDWKILD